MADKDLDQDAVDTSSAAQAAQHADGDAAAADNAGAQDNSAATDAYSAVQAEGAAQTSVEMPSDGASSETATSADDAEGDLDQELEQLREELDKARDLTLRAQADAQNAKRRADQDVEKARKFALERFSGELLPVVDNLERALEAAGGDDDAIKPIAEGVELTLKSFTDVLRKFQIEAVDPVGEPFDPQLHQAMSMIENPDAEPNTVLSVMQKGYTLNGRLIRPAMVMVSKAPASA